MHFYHRETLIHLFVGCVEVQRIWKSMEEFIRNILHYNARLNRTIILFGIDNDVSLGIEMKNAIQRVILLV